MTSTAAQDTTLHLSPGLLERVRQAARERQETPDQIVEEALLLALSPTRQQALQRLKQQVRQQQSQTEAEVRAHLEAGLSGPEQARLSRLLEQGRSGELTAQEQDERQRLFDRIEAAATEKAAALWLLSGKPPEPDAAP